MAPRPIARSAITPFTKTRGRRLMVGLAVTLGFAGVSATAMAATAEVTPQGVLEYTAAAGETNVIKVTTVDANTYRIKDVGATVQPNASNDGSQRYQSTNYRSLPTAPP